MHLYPTLAVDSCDFVTTYNNEPGILHCHACGLFIHSTIFHLEESYRCFCKVLSTQMKLNISFMPSKYVINHPWFKRWYRNELYKFMFPLKMNHVSNLLNHLFFPKHIHKLSFILSMLTSKPHEVFPLMHLLACTPRDACLAFWRPTCFYKPSNLRTSNFSWCSTTLQTLHFAILNLPSSPITASGHSNLTIQISWNTRLNSHSFFQALLSREPLEDGASIGWSPSSAVPVV